MLRVTGFSADGRGAYTAGVAPLPPLPAPISDPGTPTTVTGTWSLWQGRLADSDPDRDGKRFDDYLVRVDAGQERYDHARRGQGFDAVVQVFRAADREGEPLSRRPRRQRRRPQFDAGLRAEEAGDYIVRVTALGAGATGAYRLGSASKTMRVIGERSSPVRSRILALVRRWSRMASDCSIPPRPARRAGAPSAA